MKPPIKKQLSDGGCVEVQRIVQTNGGERGNRVSTVYVFTRPPGKRHTIKHLAELKPRDLRRIGKQAEEIRQFLKLSQPTQRIRRSVPFSDRVYYNQSS